MSNTRNVAWSAIDRLASFGISFLISVVLARLLTPHDYGLFGLMAVFIAFGTVFIDSGFTLALIQKKNRDEKDYATVFYFNIFTALILYIIFFFLSTLLADFYKQPILKDVSRVLCLILIISSFSNVQKTKMLIESQFKDLAFVSLSSSIISGIIGIYMAYRNCGVWSLVFQQITYYIIYTTSIWIVSKWKPSSSFSIMSFASMYKFGIKIFLGGILHTVYTNIYPLIIGKYFNTSQVGYYTKADSLANVPSSILTTIFDRTAFPLWSSMHDNMDQLRISFIKHLRIICFLVFPLMVLLSILSDSVIIFLFSYKWVGSAWIMSLLCLSYILFPVMDFNWQILNAIGRSDLSLKSELYNKIFSIVMLVVMSLYLGMLGLCLSLILYGLFSVILSAYFVSKNINVSIVDEIKEIMPTILNTTLMCGVVIFIKGLLSFSPIIQISLCTSIGLLFYFGIAKVFKLPEYDIIHSKIIIIRNKKWL